MSTELEKEEVSGANGTDVSLSCCGVMVSVRVARAGHQAVVLSPSLECSRACLPRRLQATKPESASSGLFDCSSRSDLRGIDAASSWEEFGAWRRVVSVAD
jgi:hypothetical protein